MLGFGFGFRPDSFASAEFASDNPQKQKPEPFDGCCGACQWTQQTGMYLGLQASLLGLPLNVMRLSYSNGLGFRAKGP